MFGVPTLWYVPPCVITTSLHNIPKERNYPPFSDKNQSLQKKRQNLSFLAVNELFPISKELSQDWK